MYAVLTHDIDSIKRPLRHILRVRSRFGLGDLLRHVLGLTNLYYNVNLILDFEDQLGARSTFFLPVFLFPITEILDDIKALIREGWEVSLHAVIEGIQREGLIRMQLEFLRDLLGFSPRGVRSHYLVINDEVLRIYASLGLDYDSSFRVESLGRWDPVVTKYGILEIPIGIMDADLFGRLHLSEESAWRYIVRKVERAKEEGARFIVFLFHQESFRMKGGRLYSRLLWWLHEKEFHFLRCVDVCNLLSREQESSIGPGGAY